MAKYVYAIKEKYREENISLEHWLIPWGTKVPS